MQFLTEIMIGRVYKSSLPLILSNSTSKISVAPAGILGGAPRSPYPKLDGITSFLFSPTHILEQTSKMLVTLVNIQLVISYINLLTILGIVVLLLTQSLFFISGSSP